MKNRHSTWKTDTAQEKQTQHMKNIHSTWKTDTAHEKQTQHKKDKHSTWKTNTAQHMKNKHSTWKLTHQLKSLRPKHVKLKSIKHCLRMPGLSKDIQHHTWQLYWLSTFIYYVYDYSILSFSVGKKYIDKINISFSLLLFDIIITFSIIFWQLPWKGKYMER